MPKGGKFAISQLRFWGQDDWSNWGHWMMGYKNSIRNQRGFPDPHFSARGEKKGLALCRGCWKIIWSPRGLQMVYFYPSHHCNASCLNIALQVRILPNTFCWSVGRGIVTGLVTWLHPEACVGWPYAQVVWAAWHWQRPSLTYLMPRARFVISDRLLNLSVHPLPHVPT